MENEKENKDIIQHYNNLGYQQSFAIESDKLVDKLSHNGYNPKQIHVVEEHKLKKGERESDSRMLIIFETNDDSKGMIILDDQDEYHRELQAFFKNIPEENYIENNEVKPSRPRLS